MDINVVQLLVGAAVSLVVGAASAWVAGTFGVRHGLERAQRERAFDRRLEWYEKAFRVLSRFRSPTVEFLIDIHRVAIPEESDKLLRQTEKSMAEIEDCLSEATLFAECEIVRELASVRLQLLNFLIELKASDPVNLDTTNLTKKLGSLGKTFRVLSFTIAKSVRGQLALDTINAEDIALREKPGTTPASM